MNNKTIAWAIVAVVLIAVNIFLGVSYPIPPQPAADTARAGDTNYTNLVVGNYLATTNQTALVITAGLEIAPTGTYQPISSTAPVTTSTSSAIADGADTGELLILRNVNASDAIVIDGAGGNVECGGNKTLGANDVLVLIWNGTDWSCIGNADN